jgi:hypothetical protein
MFNFYVNVQTKAGLVDYSNGSSLATLRADALELFKEHGEDVYAEIVLESGNEIWYNPLGECLAETFLVYKKGDVLV